MKELQIPLIRILDSENYLPKMKAKIKTLLDIQKLKEFISCSHALQKM